jgi:hypothetical protein
VAADITLMMLAYVKFSSDIDYGSGTCLAASIRPLTKHRSLADPLCVHVCATVELLVAGVVWLSFWQASTFVSLRAGISSVVALHMIFRRYARKHLNAARQMTSRSIGEQTPTQNAQEGLRGWTRGHNLQYYLAGRGVRLLLSACVTIASSFFGFKVIFQGLVKLFGFSDVCIAPGSQMDMCLHSYEKREECVDTLLNWTVSGQPTTVLTYSYEPNEDHWTMRSWGPVAAGCVPPRESSWNPVSS